MSNRSNPNRFVSVRVLRTVAQEILPFYRKIACNKRYAVRWGKAVVDADLGAMIRLFRLASPTAKHPLPGSFKSGYNIYFEFKGPIDIYGVDMLLPPGTLAQLRTQTKAHMAIARVLLPLYQKLATSKIFAELFARAIRHNNTRFVQLIVRKLVRSRYLKSVNIQGSGIALAFQFGFSSYTYEHLLYHPVFE